MENNWKMLTIVVPATHVEVARKLAACIDAAGEGMYTTPLQNSEGVVTHYISSGLLWEQFANLVLTKDPLMLYQVGQQRSEEFDISLEVIEELISLSEASEENPFDVMERMGLSLATVSDGNVAH